MDLGLQIYSQSSMARTHELVFCGKWLIVDIESVTGDQLRSYWSYLLKKGSGAHGSRKYPFHCCSLEGVSVFSSTP